MSDLSVVKDPPEAPADEDEQTELGVGEFEGHGLTIKQLIKPGEVVKTTVSMRGQEIPSSGGLIDPRRDGVLIVHYEHVKNEDVPTKEGDKGSRKITGWTIRQIVRPTYIHGAMSAATADIEAAFSELLTGDPKAAGKLLDRLREKTATALG